MSGFLTLQRPIRAVAVIAIGLLAAGQVLADSGDAASIFAEGATLQLAASDFAFTEGPAADAEGNVYFTDQPNDRILKWSPDGGVTVFMEITGRANGLVFDRAGNLLACADEHNQLVRMSPNRQVEVLVADFNGRKLNGPNDAWVAPDGGIYFTDPYYQRDYWTRTEPELASEDLYHLAPDGTLSVVDGTLEKPNGIVGSPTGDRLYVADIGAGVTYVYDRAADGKLSNRRAFAPMGSDGMTLDEAGNLYLTGDGVTVFDAAGRQIANVPVPEDWTANVTFGGRDRDILFITAMDSVYTLQMAVRGAD
jgi:gluconolactonase